MPTDFEVDAAQLILTSRWAAIATVEGGAPLASMALYLSRFPDAEMRFGLADFHLFRLVPAEIRYVGGFARAFSMTPAELAEAAVSQERPA